MLLSSCVIWRFREWDDFRAECPTGDERLQRVVWEQLDDGIAWLESLGAPVVRHETGNPRTVGKRFDPRGLTETLVRAAGDVRLGETAPEPDDSRDGRLPGRRGSGRGAHPAGRRRCGCARIRGAAETGCGYALERGGGALRRAWTEFYGRNMPDAEFSEEQFVPLAQLYGRFARVYNERGEEFFEGEVSWSENDLVQATARQPGARAWYVLDDDALEQRVRERKVRRHRGARADAGRCGRACRSRRRPGRAWRFASSRGSRTRSAACASTSSARVVGADGLLRGRRGRRAGSRRAATRAVSPPRSSSAGSRPRPCPRPHVSTRRAGRRSAAATVRPWSPAASLVVASTCGADCRHVAVGLAQLVAARLPDEQQMLAGPVRHRPAHPNVRCQAQDSAARDGPGSDPRTCLNGPSRTEAGRLGRSCRRCRPGRPSGRR